MKKCYFFVDDVIWCLRDIARQKPKSVFDQHFLSYLKKAHDMYGVKVQLNLFYRTDFFYGMDEFTLADMPDTYKEEWQSNSDWLKFAFHSFQEFPDYPFVNADYDDVKKVIDLIRGEVTRFAGKECFANALLSHWLPISKDGCRAIKDSGIDLVCVSTGTKTEYTGDPNCLPYGHAQRFLNNRKKETGLFIRGNGDNSIDNSICAYNHLPDEVVEPTLYNFAMIKDEETGLFFKKFDNGPTLNLTDLYKIEGIFSSYGDREYVGYGTHEQYSYPDYFAYQSDSAQRLLASAKALTEDGFEYFFIEEILGNAK